MAIRCDKCGEKLILKQGHIDKRYSARIYFYPMEISRDVPYLGQRIDICEKCYEKFINWLESEME